MNQTRVRQIFVSALILHATHPYLQQHSDATDLPNLCYAWPI